MATIRLRQPGQMIAFSPDSPPGGKRMHDSGFGHDSPDGSGGHHDQF
jgi:hypothetical protein